MQEFEKAAKAAKKKPPRGAHHESDTSSDEETVDANDQPDEADKAFVKAYMFEYRNAYIAEHGGEQRFFTVLPRGAPSNPARGVTIFDSTRAEASTEIARKFIKTFGIKPESFSALYTAHKCRRNTEILAEAWANKMAHFVQIWIDNGQGFYEFTDADVASWSEPENVADVLMRPDCPAPFRTRVEAIRTLKPGVWRVE